MKSLNEIVAELRMGDDGGKPAYRIGRADKVEVSMPSGTPMRSYVIEYVTIKELADWIEAAVARERVPGNAAAMYEALVKIAHYCDDQNGMDDPYCADGHILSDMARAVLSTPPRNCDVPLVVDGPAKNNADKAWLVFKYRNPDAYFDVPGLLRCIDWLLAPAAEQKGAATDGKA